MVGASTPGIFAAGRCGKSRIRQCHCGDFFRPRFFKLRNIGRLACFPLSNHVPIDTNVYQTFRVSVILFG